MKKLFVLLLTLLMAVTLAGCSQERTAGSSGNNMTDSEYVVDKGTLVVGITDFAPMDYRDDSGNWIGFDADLATAFAESLGCEVEFVEIDWDNKILELNGASIDCVWNGMTLTDEVKNSMETSNAYLNNSQIIVTTKENETKYVDVESLKDANIVVEAGSAADEILADLGIEYTPVESQAAALMELKGKTADVCVIDALMAGAMIGEGTSYPDFVTTKGLNSEEYGVGFRKNSDLAEKLNEFLKEKYADGSLEELAEKYGVQAAMIEQK